MKYFLILLALPFQSLIGSTFEEGIENQGIVIATKRLVFDRFPDAFNPSMIKTEAGYLLTFRYCPDRWYSPCLSYIGIALLDDDFNLLSEPTLLNTRFFNSKTPSQAEDARIFSYRGRLFLIYNDNPDVVSPSNWERRDMFIAELFYNDEEFSFSFPVRLCYEERYNSVLWQKNWVPFEWNKTLLLSYAINPQEIIYPNLKNGSCFRCYETFAQMDWDFGTLRGSSAAEIVDGEYLAFFHSGSYLSSSASSGQNLWHYFMGAYTFSAEPPFQVTKISPMPIVAEGFYVESHCEKRVIFPGGYVVDGSKIYLAYGKDDCEIWIATLDKEALKSSLVPVESR